MDYVIIKTCIYTITKSILILIQETAIDYLDTFGDVNQDFNIHWGLQETYLERLKPTT